MTQVKAVLFSRLSAEDVKSGHSLFNITQKLRKYADHNNLAIANEYSAIEDMDFGASPTLSTILDFIQQQNEHIAIVCYHSNNYDSKTDIGERLQTFIVDKKLSFRHYCHPCFKEPSNDETKTWRYINLVKFIDLLQSNTLFFTRADSLRRMDKFEGAYLTNYSKQINAIIAAGKMSLPSGFGLSAEQYLMMQQQMDNYNEETGIKKFFINCWHMADFENFAMWKIYSDTFGVCIQSTYQRLRESFADGRWSIYDDNKHLYIGEIIYIDRNSAMIPQNNGFWPYMHKGVEFNYERELRCVIWDIKGQNQSIKVRVDANRLVQVIHISPFAPEWFRLIIENLCVKYNLEPNKIRQSTLS